MYEERRLVVGQSCGELAKFVWPDIRDSVILSIVQQLIQHSATIAREVVVRLNFLTCDVTIQTTKRNTSH